MKRRTKIVVGSMVALAVVGAAAFAVIRSRGPQGVRVKTSKVDKKDLVSVVTANGTVQAKTKVDISANIMGQITSLFVEEGQAVRKGDLLLVIDQATPSAMVQSRRAGLEALEAEAGRVREAAAQARRDLDRIERQYREQIVATADYERARSQADQTAATVRAVERQIAQARADLSASQDALHKTEIRAPMDGVVTRRSVEQGEVVVTGTMNNPGTVLMTISDMSTIEAVLEVDQTDVPSLRIGQPATVLIDAFADRPFPGEVTEIGSSPIRGTSALGQAATGTDYEVKVTLKSHPEGIRPGLTVTADIVTATREKVLTVPIGALVLRQEGAPPPRVSTDPGEPEGAKRVGLESVSSRTKDVEGVYVVTGGKAEFRPVTTGIKGELDVEVGGLREGDEVIVGPFKALRELKPGASVVVDNTEKPELET
jgi:HlyD family secretion protein